MFLAFFHAWPLASSLCSTLDDLLFLLRPEASRRGYCTDTALNQSFYVLKIGSYLNKVFKKLLVAGTIP